jgi:hypothetical protein
MNYDEKDFMMKRIRNIPPPAVFWCILFWLLLALPACSNPSPEPQPTEIYTTVHISYYVPDLSDVITFSPVVVVASVEPTQITYNWHEPKPVFEGFLQYRRMRVYRIHVESYLRGSGEMVLYMGRPEGDSIMAKTQEELDAKIAADSPDAPRLEVDKRYLLFLSAHTFDYRPKELDLPIFYEGFTPLNTFEITESGEAIPVLTSTLRDKQYPMWTLDEFIRYIERPDLIPTPTPWPTPEPVESYPIPLKTVVPYPFPLGTPFPYDTYPEPEGWPASLPS